MRISSFEIQRQAASQLQALGAEVARTQQQIAHGKRIVNPSDDPVGAARVVKINQEIGARDQYLRNLDRADYNLALEDSVLAQITDVMLRVQELTIQAGSGIQTVADQRFIAAEVKERFEELLSLVNTRDSDGQYIFAGFNTDTMPFVVTGNEIEYRGDNGQRQLQIDRGQRVTINDSGQRLFVDVDTRVTNATGIQTISSGPSSSASPSSSVSPSSSSPSSSRIGAVEIVDSDLADSLHPDRLVIQFQPLADGGGQPNFTVVRQSDQRPVDGLVNVPYASGAPIVTQGVSFRIDGAPQVGDQFVVETHKNQGLLQTVNNIANSLGRIDASVDPEEFRSLIDGTLVGIENAMESVLQVRADVGARLNTMDTVRDLHLDLSLQLTQVLSSIEDLDFAEAVSRLSYQSFVLEAAQQSFVRISRLSLFNVLR